MSETRQRLRRPAASDDEVKEFVRRILAQGAQPAKTRLLHQLRESGIACEQSRFGRLYAQVKSQ